MAKEQQIDENELNDKDEGVEASLDNDENVLSNEHQDVCKFLTFRVDKEVYGVDLLSI